MFLVFCVVVVGGGGGEERGEIYLFLGNKFEYLKSFINLFLKIFIYLYKLGGVFLIFKY